MAVRPPTAAQRRILNLMRETNQPLVMRKYIENGHRIYRVGDEPIKRVTALKLIPMLVGGAMEVEMAGQVEIRKYALPPENLEKGSKP